MCICFIDEPYGTHALMLFTFCHFVVDHNFDIVVQQFDTQANKNIYLENLTIKIFQIEGSSTRSMLQRNVYSGMRILSQKLHS